jgi:hypothetical protein
MELIPLFKGAVRPILRHFRRAQPHASGGSEGARYCYSAWLRHVASLSSLGVGIPERLVELGPGLSLGTGVCARLTGVSRYWALDAFRDADADRTLAILDQVASLFSSRAPIPDHDEFPELWPRLTSYAFPSAVTESVSSESVQRVAAEVRQAFERGFMLSPQATGITYNVQEDSHALNGAPAEADLVLSQAVFEHVVNPRALYSSTAAWLRPGGACSHTIDFRSHSFTSTWYGHWEYPSAFWRIVEAAGTNHLNRLGMSDHLDLLRAEGFEILIADGGALPRESWAPRHLVDAGRIKPGDESTPFAHIIARRSGEVRPLEHAPDPRSAERRAKAPA